MENKYFAGFCTFFLSLNWLQSDSMYDHELNTLVLNIWQRMEKVETSSSILPLGVFCVFWNCTQQQRRKRELTKFWLFTCLTADGKTTSVRNYQHVDVLTILWDYCLNIYLEIFFADICLIKSLGNSGFSEIGDEFIRYLKIAASSTGNSEGLWIIFSFKIQFHKFVSFSCEIASF